jgi:hypothetical protein
MVNPKAASTTALVGSGSPALVGQQVTFTATVSGAAGTPTGTMFFRDGSVGLASVPLDGNGTATFSTAGLSVGLHTIYAIYLGSSSYATSYITLRQAIVQPSTTSLTAAPNPATFGQVVTFTATVSGAGGIPTGSVIFKDGSTTLASVALVNGVATFSTSRLVAGTHSISAGYGGSTSYAASSGTTGEIVNPR